MPITLNHSNIGVQYSTGSNYIIETVKSDLYRRNEIVDTIVRDNIQTAPVTPIISIQEGSNVYAVESYTYSGTANTADFTRVFPKSTTCDILIVGGGGGGGYHTGGGGGAGGYYYQKNAVITTGTYIISVGNGGIAAPNNDTRGGNGSDTSFYGITAKGGGGGASDNAPSGNSGGSGGGADWNGTAGLDTDTNTEGNNGGTPINITGEYYGSGGGGAGSSGFTNGNGGEGKSNSITGTNTFYAAGGGGGRNQGTNWSGIGGSSIGGNGGNGTIAGTSGLNGTGSGGGGGGFYTGGSAGKGGSGIVIIRYLLGTIPSNNYLTSEPVVVAPTFTETTRTFAHSGGAETQTTHTITVGRDTICDILVVGGGGGGGLFGGGGGAGSILFANNLLLNAGSYTIKVGKGGTGASNDTANGTNGIDSSILINAIEYISKGGGGGGSRQSGAASFAGRNGSNGGSGGGGSSSDTIETIGGSTTTNTYKNWETYGNAGGKGKFGSSPWVSGGGGGAGSAGSDWSNTKGGNGGSGKSFVSYFGTNVGHNGWFGGGGGGNMYWSGGTFYDYGYGNGGNGLSGGGGNGANETNVEISATGGLPNTGGGGGGGKWDGTATNGGNGGSGIVIIKFKSTTAILDGITHKRLNFAYNNDNLVAWYKFNGDYFDSSGNGHNLTNVGSVIQSTHIIEGQAVEFDSTDYLEFPATINPYTIWNNGKGITFSCWVRFIAHETNAVLMDFQPSLSNSSGILIGFKTTSGGNKALIIFVNNITIFSYSDWNNPLIATLNVWRHLVFCVDVAGKWDVYLDNVRINGTETANIPNITYNFRFINRTVWGSTVMWDGQMDDFRIYDRALSATDVSLLYNKTYPIPNLYTLNFPVPTIADINNNSNIVLRGAYDIALSTSNALIIPKEGQHIHNPSVLIRDSSERIYPPVRNFTSDTTIISGQLYGNGTYIVSASTFFIGEETFRVFNGTNSGWTQSTSKYDGSPAGTYTGLLSLGGFTGEWIKVQLPVSIKLTRYIIEASSIGGVNRAPSIYKIFGSNNNIDWEQVVYKSVPLVSADYISSKYEEKVSSNNYYRFFALVIGKNIGLDVWLGIGEWYIYGQEFSNNSLSIRYNILNPILDPIGAQWTYNSSNTNVYHMGSVGIGTTNPEYQLDVRGAIYSSVGGYTQTGLTTWTVTSDKRIKDNIVRASYDKCLENVKNIELYNFNFKNNCVNTNDKHQLGFIAQEVREVYPKAVEVGKMILNTNEAIDDILTLNTTQIDYTLYGAVKNLIEKIDNIDIELENLDSNITYNKDLIRNTSNISITTSNIFTGT
jgi:hypothetical protein